ncbi:MAG: 7,8-didemethyl-8-hydroxy-5-deazariboflavin synthase subunit CofG [Candidatus Heimdallarchaeota archaeon]
MAVRSLTAESLSREEAYELYQEIQQNPGHYAKKAAAVRDKHYLSLTVSKNLFVPLTYWCRNDCLYCQFRRTSGKPFLSEEEVQQLVNQGRTMKCPEILFTMGEKPEDHFSNARQWLDTHGYSSTIDYLVQCCKIALEAGLLPHSNPGVLTYSELARLANVNASMGLMLETYSKRLQLPGQAHAKSPTKNPEKRLDFIRNAGKLKVPFTTGLLIGIGETSEELVDGILAIHEVNERYSHIQEVIIQNVVMPETTSRAPNLQSCPPEKLFSAIILARLLLDPEISIQVPPNLNKGFEEQLITIGINDWGGISQVTIDQVNPRAPWPDYKHLQEISEKYGFNLLERLPVYPRFINSHWLRPKVFPIAKKWQQKLENQLQ